MVKFFSSSNNPLSMLRSRIGKPLAALLAGFIIVAIAIGAYFYGDQIRQSSQEQNQVATQENANQDSLQLPGSEPDNLPGINSNDSDSDPDSDSDSDQETEEPVETDEQGQDQDQDQAGSAGNSSSGSLGNNGTNSVESSGQSGELANTGPEDTAAIITTILVLMAIKYRNGRRGLQV